MLDELEQREREFKKVKVDQQKKQQEIHRENEAVMEQGKRLREEKEKEMLQREEETRKVSECLLDEPPSLGTRIAPSVRRNCWAYPLTCHRVGSLDTTVRLKYSATALPHLTTPESLAALLEPFGKTDADSIVLSIKTRASKKKKASSGEVKLGTALVPFKRIGDAFAAVCASGVRERGLEGVQISWAGNNGEEPGLIGWLKRHGKLGAPSETTKDQKPSSSSPNSVSAPLSCLGCRSDVRDKGTLPSVPAPTSIPGLDFESLTLMRMREAERARLEREILEQEAAEG
jgi:DnaJ family protein C protein 17